MTVHQSLSPTPSSNFADGTTVVKLVSGGDGSAYRDEVQKLTGWCSVNNLTDIVNNLKT